MKLKGIETRYGVEIEISSSELSKKIIEELCKKHGYNTNQYINEYGDLIEETECGGSHTWWDKKVLRRATDKDREFFTAIKYIRSL